MRFIFFTSYAHMGPSRVTSGNRSIDHLTPGPMGQYFTIVNIDKREHSSFSLCKLGEFLFTDEPNRVLYHILRLTVTFKSLCDDSENDAIESR
jgi:hypothetical protein